MFAFTTARLIGSITFIREVLAHQRWHDANFSARGSGWTQDEKLSGQWGTGPDAGHLALSSFCAEFAATVGNLHETAEFPDHRRKLAIAHLERWAKAWGVRAALYKSPNGVRTRLAALSKLAKLDTYADIYSGGLGPRALARDLAATLGIQLA
jgi:hypothetical protein